MLIKRTITSTEIDKYIFHLSAVFYVSGGGI